MAKFKLPASLDEAVRQLEGLSELLRVKEWEKAAIVATFVRLDNVGGRNARKPRVTAGFMSATQFSELGLAGLRSPNTVTMYVQRWLDANDGVYPVAGEAVTLPRDEWPPTSLEDDRYQDVSDAEAIRSQAELDGTGASKSIDIAKNTKAMGAAIKASPTVAAAALRAMPPEAIAIAARDPEVAAAILDDYQASTTMTKTAVTRRKNKVKDKGGKGRSKSGGGVVSAIDKALMKLGAVAYEADGRKLVQNLQARHQSELPWQPGEFERLVELVVSGIDHGMTAKALLTPVSDEDLAELLGQNK